MNNYTQIANQIVEIKKDAVGQGLKAIRLGQMKKQIAESFMGGAITIFERRVLLKETEMSIPNILPNAHNTQVGQSTVPAETS